MSAAEIRKAEQAALLSRKLAFCIGKATTRSIGLPKSKAVGVLHA